MIIVRRRIYGFGPLGIAATGQVIKSYDVPDNSSLAVWSDSILLAEIVIGVMAPAIN